LQELRKRYTRKQCIVSAIFVFIAVGGVFVGAALAAGVAYVQTFDGVPTTPQSVRPLLDWDVTVHSRDPEAWYQLNYMEADHGPDCSAPPNHHSIASAGTTTAYEDSVFLCNGHIMTALNASGYGAIYLTPNQLLDWSAGEAVLRWDMSTRVTSGRDWVTVDITPYEQHLALPLVSWLPDLVGLPPTIFGVGLTANPAHPPFTWGAGGRNNGQTYSVPSNLYVGYESFLVPDAARRDTFELRLTRTHVKFGMPAYNFYWIDTDVPDIGFGSGVVQFSHHSYNPYKDCDNANSASTLVVENPPAPVGCGPNTWHWDNVSFSSAVPFTIIKASPRYVDSTSPPTLTFASPAPVGSHLRFGAWGSNVQVSLDNGVTWQPARVQPAEKSSSTGGGFWQSYWHPIPAGTTQLRVKAEGGWWGSNWMVRDISLWAASASSGIPLPTATATRASTVTPTTTTASRTPTPTAVLGDLNGDGIVDIRDYGQWRRAYGGNGCGLPGDLNGDCVVDIRDYGLWRQNFGATKGSTARPSSGALPAPGGLGSTPVPSAASTQGSTPMSSATPTQTRTLTPVSLAPPIRTVTPTLVRQGVDSAHPHS
jgi:hypothetical protein